MKASRRWTTSSGKRQSGLSRRHRTGSANSQMDNDVTPVYLAAQEGHLEVLKFLVLEAGGSLYVRAKDGMAPVHAAAQMGCLTALKWMIADQGVEPNLKDGDGATPLHFAASRGHVDTVRWLLRHGARLTLDKYGKSPINDAAENQQMECLNILVQHGTTPDYQDDQINGKLHGCTCRKGDPQEKCSYADCVNYASPRAPFYLHPPSSRTESPPHDGLYVNPMTAKEDNSSVSSANSESFYLHNPQLVVYNRVKHLFESPTPRRGNSEPPPTPNGLTVKVEVHSSSSGAGSEENLSSSELSERSGEHEHDYEDIYHIKESRHNGHGHNGTGKSIRSRSRDSGSHSRSGSVSSTNSGGIVVTLGPHANDTQSQDQPSMTPSTESGVSSGAPSDMGHSEEENEKSPNMKSAHRHSLPHSGHPRQLKRVVSEPSGMCPPPPPPPPPPNMFHQDISRRSSSSTDDGSKKDDGTTKYSGGEDGSEAETLVPASPLNKQLVLPFIPPKFPSNGEDCLIKPSEYLKSIGGTRPQSVASSTNGTLVHKNFTKSLEQKLNELGGGDEGPPPPPPMPGLDISPGHYESSEPASPGSTKARKIAQPLSTISIHDLNSVQLRRTDKTAVHKTMSTPVKPHAPGGVVEPFQAQKQDLIAELKMSRDIEGVKKMKTERLKTEENKEKELASELAKQLNANTVIDKIPEKDATGNPIPPWKRQMMAKKAAEKARKDLEEQMKREAEEKRLQSIPAWKRQLIAKKEETEAKSCLYTPKVIEEKKTPQVIVKEVNGHCNGETNGEINNNKENNRPEEKTLSFGELDAPIIPWRAQLRKTNSKLSLLE